MASIDDAEHTLIRTILRIVGIGLLLTGVVLIVLGGASVLRFITAFESPSGALLGVVGLAVLALGWGICRYAFLGAVSRYVANEIAPVGTDVVNYVSDGTRDAVRDVAAAVGEGLQQASSAPRRIGARCPQCNTENNAAASFCKGCGARLSKPKACPHCGQWNDADARFCESCGTEAV